MKKIIALDLGDRWVGIAISDATNTLSRPLDTVDLKELESFLKQLLTREQIYKIIVGHPKTLKGLESEQTKKIVLKKEELEKQFPNQEWILWDERLSSKRAETGKLMDNKEARLRAQARAAAFILDSYLSFLKFS